MPIIRPALYHLVTKTIIKQPKQVPFVVRIMTRSFNLFVYCCSPLQKSLISTKRVSLVKVMRTNILVSSCRLER